MEVRDIALEEVYAELKAADPDGKRMAMTLRNTLDQLYDGQHTGRYRWDQLFKTEKTYCGTLVEINLQRDFDFDNGAKLDYSIAGHEVDCKYSQRDGGWMIPNEAHGELCLVVTADDASSSWSAGVVRATKDALGVGRNRDAKATLSTEGRERIMWLQREAELSPNVLLTLPDETVQRIFRPKSGQQRLNELFRLVQRRRISRGVVATVAQQHDYMKRVRYNGGSRSQLRPEGIVILGDYSNHRLIAQQLGVEPPEDGESVSIRLAACEAGTPWSASIDGATWRVARDEDPIVEAPYVG
jgi:hypothetical protein